jgi:PAS domain S-box-containing protein
MEAQSGLFVLTPFFALIANAFLLVVVLRRTARSQVYRSFSLYVLVMAIWSFASGMARVDPGRILLWYRVLFAAVLLMPVAYLRFVQALLDQEQDRWLWVAVAGMVVLQIANWFGLIVTDARPLGDGLVTYETGPIIYVAALYWVFFLGWSAWHLAHAHNRSSDAAMRSRIRYPLVGLSFVIAGAFANAVPALRPLPMAATANMVNALLLVYSILRFQLLGITTAVRKGLVYTVAIAVVCGGYLLVVFLAVDRFHLVTGYQVILLSLILATGTAVAFQPLRNQVQSGVDKLLFRDKYDFSRMLQRLSHTATSVLDLDRLGGMILDEVTTSMDITRGVFLLKREEGGEFRMMAQRRLLRGTHVSLEKSHPIALWLSRSGRVLTRHDLDAMPQFGTLDEQERQDLDAMGFELFLPLMVRGELIGILVFGPHITGASYSPDELLTLTTLANQTAVAIENARLFTLEQKKAEEFSALLDIARAVSSTLDLSQLLEAIAERTAQVCGVDRCSILLLDQAGDRLVPLMSQFAHGGRDERLWGIFKEGTYSEMLDADTPVRRVLREREPVIFDENLASFLPAGWVEPFGIKSLLAVPLIRKDEPIGMMVLDHIKGGQRFTDEQVSLATTIGTQVTIAIENARLYEETVEEKERTETIVEQAFAGIMVIDPEMQILTLNPEVEAITGYSFQELLGKRLSEVFGPELWGEGSLLGEVMATGERVAVAEATLSGKNGARDILLGVTPIRDGYLLNFADITRLKEVDRLKSSIVANVSHELRAPLASIKAYTELLLDNLDGEDRALRHRFLSIIDQEVDWLTELINDLLDLSRLESEQYAPQMGLVSMSEIVDGVLALLDVQIQKKRISLHLDASSDLPSILGDKELMTVLVKNLVGNAVKFSLEEGHVDIGMWGGDDNLVLCVVDHGMGIPGEDLPHLFTKFYRSALARESGIRGTGLGLVLAKEATEIHEGQIELESELGVGTRVTVTLPINREVVSESSRRGEQSRG